MDDNDDTRTKWVEEAGRRAIALPGDLRDRGYCEDLVKRTVDSVGGLDILVNNAAFHIEIGELAEISTEPLEQTFRTNIFAYIWMAQAALPHLQPGSVIINSGSVVAMSPYPQLIDYAATKPAIHGLSLLQRRDPVPQRHAELLAMTSGTRISLDAAR